MVMVRGVILDVDGTLVDSNGPHAETWAVAARELGFNVFVEDARKWIGMGSDLLIPKLVGVSAASEMGRKLKARKSEIFRSEYVRHLEPFAESRRFVEQLLEDGHRVAVASSARAADTEMLLEIADVADLVPDEMRVSGNEISVSKPHPHAVLAAVERLELKPREIVMIGDTPYDIEAAGKAGVDVIALRSGGWSDRDLRGALHIFDDVAELLANYDLTELKPGVHRGRHPHIKDRHPHTPR